MSELNEERQAPSSQVERRDRTFDLPCLLLSIDQKPESRMSPLFFHDHFEFPLNFLGPLFNSSIPLALLKRAPPGSIKVVPIVGREIARVEHLSDFN